jgi:hypothetical protein
MKPQTKATKKWDEKNGVTAKTYKLPKSIVEDFAEACEEADVSPAKMLAQLMQIYIDGGVYESKRNKGAIFLPRQ